jgi:membrane fusion protein, multidrug efflux system
MSAYRLSGIRRFCRPVLVLPVLLGAVLSACSGGASNDAAPQAALPAPEVTVMTMQPEAVMLTRELPGRSAPYLVAEVRPQVSGLVEDVLFTEGGLVKEGQPLYQLNDDTYGADVKSARATLVKAEATRNAASLTARRYAELVKVNAVSRQEHENAVAALKQAEADVGVARAALDRASLVSGHARITSPISGRIGRSTITKGALVTANQVAPLATVQQLDPIYVDLTQSSSELLQLRKQLASGSLTRSGDVPVRILLEDGTPFEHEGKLAFSEVTVDPTTGSFALRVVVQNPDHILMPGMYVRAIVGNGTREDAILVPQQAVARDARGGTTVMVVGADGTVETRPVQTSRTIGDKWLVDDGLAAGDRVVLEGLQKIRPGMQVKVTEALTTVAAAEQ